MCQPSNIRRRVGAEAADPAALRRNASVTMTSIRWGASLPKKVAPRCVRHSSTDVADCAVMTVMCVMCINGMIWNNTWFITRCYHLYVVYYSHSHLYSYTPIALSRPWKRQPPLANSLQLCITSFECGPVWLSKIISMPSVVSTCITHYILTNEHT